VEDHVADAVRSLRVPVMAADGIGGTVPVRCPARPALKIWGWRGVSREFRCVMRVGLTRMCVVDEKSG
jgi:hypothetical protein